MAVQVLTEHGSECPESNVGEQEPLEGFVYLVPRADSKTETVQGSSKEQ